MLGMHSMKRRKFHKEELVSASYSLKVKIIGDLK